MGVGYSIIAKNRRGAALRMKLRATNNLRIVKTVIDLIIRSIVAVVIIIRSRRRNVPLPALA